MTPSIGNTRLQPNRGPPAGQPGGVVPERPTCGPLDRPGARPVGDATTKNPQLRSRPPWGPGIRSCGCSAANPSFGSRTISERLLALRPRLATGVPFRLTGSAPLGPITPGRKRRATPAPPCDRPFPNQMLHRLLRKALSCRRPAAARGARSSFTRAGRNTRLRAPCLTPCGAGWPAGARAQGCVSPPASSSERPVATPYFEKWPISPVTARAAASSTERGRSRMALSSLT